MRILKHGLFQKNGTVKFNLFSSSLFMYKFFLFQQIYNVAGNIFNKRVGLVSPEVQAIHFSKRTLTPLFTTELKISQVFPVLAESAEVFIRGLLGTYIWEINA